MSLTAPIPADDQATTIPHLVEALAVSRSTHDEHDAIDGIITHAFTLETLNRYSDGQLRLRLRGELDIAIAREVRNFLKAKIRRGNDIEIDLSNLTFLDTAGLASLTEPISHARDYDQSITLTGSLQPQVERLLQLTDTVHLVHQPVR